MKWSPVGLSAKALGLNEGPVARRALALLRRPAVRRACLATSGAGLLSPFVPLANVPGYESAAIATLLSLAMGGIAGVASARQERLEAGSDGPFSQVVRASAAALLLALLPLAATLTGALVAGALGPSCSLTDGLGWYPILTLPTAALASTFGVACGALTRRRKLPGLLFLCGVAASFLYTAWPVLTGPQVFLYDHLLGYLPGPLYDEVVEIQSPLLFFRLFTLAQAVALLGATTLFWREGRLSLAPRPHLAGLFLLTAGGALSTWGLLDGSRLGFRQSNETVARALGATTEGTSCVVVHPREMKKEKVARFVAECDHRMDELQSFFGVEGRHPTVFLYRNRGEKKWLVGASGTQFAKPWLQQLHVDERGWPHPVLKHELAHLVTATMGRPPFGVTSVAMGLLPVQGLIEGAAVAADWPPGELTVHQQARAMRLLGLAPSLPKILSALGFYGQPASRAYTYAGSFVRWLVEEHGPASFGRLYEDGDFAAAYGMPLEKLVAQWERWLDETALPPRALAVAERRFKRPAIFRRPCARQVAELTGEARAAFAAGDLERAADIYGRCAKLDGGDPGHLLSRLHAFAAAGQSDRVRELAEAIGAHPGNHTLLEASTWISLGDSLAVEGKREEAAGAWTEALSFQLDRAMERNLQVKVEAVADEALARVVFPYLTDGGDSRLLAIRDLLEERPDYGTGWYLIGRRLHQRDDPEGAIAHLDKALAAGLPSPLLEREARRTRALALLATDRASEACAEFERLGQQGDEGERLESLDLLGLCRHQARLTSTAGR